MQLLWYTSYKRTAEPSSSSTFLSSRHMNRMFQLSATATALNYPHKNKKRLLIIIFYRHVSYVCGVRSARGSSLWSSSYTGFLSDMDVLLCGKTQTLRCAYILCTLTTTTRVECASILGTIDTSCDDLVNGSSFFVGSSYVGITRDA